MGVTLPLRIPASLFIIIVLRQGFMFSHYELGITTLKGVLVTVILHCTFITVTLCKTEAQKIH